MTSSTCNCPACVAALSPSTALALITWRYRGRLYQVDAQPDECLYVASGLYAMGAESIQLLCPATAFYDGGRWCYDAPEGAPAPAVVETGPDADERRFRRERFKQSLDWALEEYSRTLSALARSDD